MAPRFKIPLSVLVVIHTPALEVLLIRRTDMPAVWQSVTGSQDRPDEPLEATARREVFEETGIDCRPGTALESALVDWQVDNVFEIHPRWRHRYAPGVSLNTEHWFGLRLPAPIPVRLNPREHTAHQWLPLQQAAQTCWSASNARAIQRLQGLVVARESA